MVFLQCVCVHVTLSENTTGILCSRICRCTLHFSSCLFWEGGFHFHQHQENHQESGFPSELDCRPHHPHQFHCSPHRPPPPLLLPFHTLPLHPTCLHHWNVRELLFQKCRHVEQQIPPSQSTCPVQLVAQSGCHNLS